MGTEEIIDHVFTYDSEYTAEHKGKMEYHINTPEDYLLSFSVRKEVFECGVWMADPYCYYPDDYVTYDFSDFALYGTEGDEIELTSKQETKITEYLQQNFLE